MSSGFASWWHFVAVPVFRPRPALCPERQVHTHLPSQVPDFLQLNLKFLTRSPRRHPPRRPARLSSQGLALLRQQAQVALDGPSFYLISDVHRFLKM